MHGSIRIPIQQLLMVILCGVMLCLSRNAGAELTPRALIEAQMAAHPGNAALQERGHRLLDELAAWEEALEAAGHTPTEPVGSVSPRDEWPAPLTGPAALPNPMEGLDSWDVNQNWIGVSVADQAWTLDRMYEGTVQYINARYSFNRVELPGLTVACDCNPPPPAPFRSIGTVRGAIQNGTDGIERAYFGVEAVGWQRNFEQREHHWHPLHDTLELGALIHGKDDPLGLESYTEITIARGGRTWAWNPRDKSFLFMAGLGGSIGWAWAESSDPTYTDVSNPIAGFWLTLGIARPGWGKAYVEQRAINGFQFSNPSDGGSTSREARFRFGIIKKFESCLSVEAFIDKRSFNFSDHRLPDIYTKARRTGLEVGCSW